jgi:hypothetical protein
MAVLLASILAIVLAAAPVEAERVVIDLTVSTPCADDRDETLEDEILVCAKIDGASPYRIVGARDATTEPLPHAELQLSDDAKLSAETESADLGMARSQRLMVRLKFKF